MKDILKNGFTLFYIGLIIILIAIFIDYFDESIWPVLKVKREYNKIQSQVNDDEKFILSVFNDFQDKQFSNIYQNYSQLLNYSSQKEIFFYIFLNNKLVLWTSNKVIPDLTDSLSNQIKLVRLDNGYYLKLARHYQLYTIIALRPVQSTYPFENKYLTNNIQLGNKSSYFTAEEINNNTQKGLIIKDLSKNPVFILNSNLENVKRDWVFAFYLLGGILIMIFIHRQINRVFRQKQDFHAAFIFLATLTLSYLGWKVFRIPKILFRHEIFSPQIYASSSFLSSIGDLLVAVFLTTWTITLLTTNVKIKVKDNIRSKSLVFGFLYLLSLFLIKAIEKIIEGLIINSDIPTDTIEFLSFNFYSIIAYFIIFMMLYTFIRLLIYFSKISHKSNLKKINWFFLILTPSIIYYFIFPFNLTQVNHFILPSFVLLCWLIIYNTDFSRNQLFSISLSLILICSGFTAQTIANANKIRNTEKKKLLFNSIISGRDALAEGIISEQIVKIKNDNFIPSFFTNPMISEVLLHKRIKQLYFSGYLSNYDCIIKTYTIKGTPFKSTDSNLFSYYSSCFENSTPIDNDSSFYFHNNYDGAAEYLISFNVKNYQNYPGKILIILRKKTFQEESIYPDLLVERNIQRTYELSKYSFAIYKNNQLINQKGNYSYPLIFYTFDKSEEEFNNFTESGYEHLVNHVNEDITVILSNEKSNIFNSLSLFSLLFFLSTVIFSIINYINNIILPYNKRHANDAMRKMIVSPFKRLMFKQKIQITILFSLLVSFVISGYFTINMIIENSNKNHNKKLQHEISIVSERINEILTSNDFYSDEFFTAIKTISEQINTDINVYDKSGYLLTSSQLSIYERKIISKFIDAHAYYLLLIKKKSQLVNTESIGGKLNFFSAYMPLRNAENQIIGFVNLPYYSKESALQNEVSSLLVTFVNLYVFLFLLAILVSFSISTTFTEPLENIRKHLSDLRFGIPNKKIAYNSADEIGELITEYNKMIDNVEKSAEALSRSEREMAWREMAQQIAHEIKNPLTPMKLNLQQLLRAWEDKAPDLEDRFRKTTEILINRIDSLSAIATEFSEFARMPEPKADLMIINNVVNEIADLYRAVERVKLVVVMHEENIKVNADYQQIIRAMNNLVRNAFQAIPQDKTGEVTIAVHKSENQAIIEVKDTGTGINLSLQDKIFMPNFSTKSSGMGLGLAIVEKIIKSAKGEIWFETEEGKGTSFYFSLPLAE